MPDPTRAAQVGGRGAQHHARAGELAAHEAGTREARDPYLEAALKPAEALTEDDRAFLLKHSFYSDPHQMIYRYPRYGELFDARNSQAETGAPR